MNLENNDLYSSEMDDLQLNVAQTTELGGGDATNDLDSDIHASINPALVAYGVHHISELPPIKDKINDCKEAIAEKFSDAKEAVGEFLENVGKSIEEYTLGVYDSVKDFFTGTKEAEARELSMYSREFSETREFGIDRCVEAAKDLFNPGVIDEWTNLTYDERAQICYMYADEVAKAFELENYNGVIFEEMEPGVLGSNKGDGYIHLTVDMLDPYETPLNLIDTITHELRHQYQSECVQGFHDVADEVRNEWSVATVIYTTDAAWSYDPWGYEYNPLEIDSRYAGNSVVRELTSQMFNDAIAMA